MARDFIISSLSSIPDDAPDAGAVDFAHAREVTAIGTQLVSEHRRGGVLDLSRLMVALHRALFLGQLTPLARGIVVARTLEQLTGSDWITAAADLAHGLNGSQLHGIGSAGLLALRAALKAGCPERCEHALKRVEAVLAQRAPVEVSDAGGLWVVVEGWGVTEAQARAVVRKSLPDLRGRLGGSVVLAVSKEESATSRGVWVEHYRRCAEVLSAEGLAALERASRYGRVLLMPQEQLLPARARTAAERAWALLSKLNTVLRPVRERIFVPAEI